MRSTLMRLSLAIAAWCAFAFGPSVAQASPLLTFPTGTPLATDSLLQVTNIGIPLYTEAEWKIECSTAKFTGKLVTNSGSTIEIELSSMEIHGPGVGGDCKRDRTNTGVTEEGASVNITYSGLPWCFKATKSMAADNYEIRGGRCAEAAKPATVVLNYTGLAECKYQTASITGIFTTHPEDAKLALQPMFERETTNSFLCPTTIGSDTDMTMERDSLTSEPVYIS